MNRIDYFGTNDLTSHLEVFIRLDQYFILASVLQWSMVIILHLILLLFRVVVDILISQHADIPILRLLLLISAIPIASVLVLLIMTSHIHRNRLIINLIDRTHYFHILK